MKKLTVMMAVFTIGVSLLSCKKDKENDEPKDDMSADSGTQSSQDNNKQQREFDDVMNIAFLAINENVSASNNSKIASDLCATVTQGESTNELIVDFGEAGCQYNNITRKGKVIFYYTGHYKDSGSVIQVSLDNYRVQNTYASQDFVKVEGKETITNKGLINGKVNWVVNVEDAKLTFENGEESTWESIRTRVLEDEGTANPFDEIYHIYGNASGVNRKGGTYTASIIKEDPVIFDFPCWIAKRMLVGGTITVKPEGEVIRSVDYGYEKEPGESCDRSVTITYGTFSFNIDL